MRRKSWAALDDLTKNQMHSLKIVNPQKRLVKFGFRFCTLYIN